MSTEEEVAATWDIPVMVLLSPLLSSPPFLLLLFFFCCFFVTAILQRKAHDFFRYVESRLLSYLLSRYFDLKNVSNRPRFLFFSSDFFLRLFSPTVFSNCFLRLFSPTVFSDCFLRLFSPIVLFCFILFSSFQVYFIICLFP